MSGTLEPAALEIRRCQDVRWLPMLESPASPTSSFDTASLASLARAVAFPVMPEQEWELAAVMKLAPTAASGVLGRRRFDDGSLG